MVNILKYIYFVYKNHSKLTKCIKLNPKSKMTSKFEIYRIDYDLISRSRNVNHKEKALLFGASDQFIAAKPYKGGFYVLMDTIGKRDVCAKVLEEMENTEQVY